MAVRAGHAEIVELLLEEGADPGQSVYTYNSWDKLLQIAKERGHRQVESILERAMTRGLTTRPISMRSRKRSSPGIRARSARSCGGIRTWRRVSDALGNNALHWSVITRQLSLIERFVELGTPIDAQRADGQTPVLLAVNGANDYWYRATRGRSHPSTSKRIRDGWDPARPGSEIHHLRGGGRWRSGTRRAALEEGCRSGRGVSTRRESAPYPMRPGKAICTSSACCSSRAPIRILRRTSAPDGLALYGACRGNHLDVAQLLLEHGANPNAGVDSSECCLTIGEVYHGDQAKPLQQLLRRHGAYTPPYHMSVQEMKHAIRGGHEVTRHAEFLGNLMGKRNVGLLDLYLDSDPTAVERWQGVTYPRSAAMVRRLLARGLDPNRPDWLGKTFLHACAENGDRSVAAVFLDAGADINARGLEFHETPLAAAVRYEPWCKEDRPKLPERGDAWSSSC